MESSVDGWWISAIYLHFMFRRARVTQLDQGFGSLQEVRPSTWSVSITLLAYGTDPATKLLCSPPLRAEWSQEIGWDMKQRILIWCDTWHDVWCFVSRDDLFSREQSRPSLNVGVPKQFLTESLNDKGLVGLQKQVVTGKFLYFQPKHMQLVMVLDLSICHHCSFYCICICGSSFDRVRVAAAGDLSHRL